MDGECEPGGACCASDGTCSQTCEDDCDGVWQGAGTSCDDIDCESGCCTSVTSPDGGCGYSICVRGETGGCTPCDPDEEQPEEPVTDCSGGTPTSVTVTGSGYVANSGDPVFDAELNGMMNNSYSVDLSCNGSGSQQFTSGGYFVNVTVGLAGVRSAGMNVIFNNSSVAVMELVAAAESPSSTDCGSNIYPCGVYSGAVTSVSGIGDFTGADIDVA